MGKIISALASAQDEGWDDLVTNTNFPGVIVLAMAGLPTLFFLMRWLIKFQREFTEFYIAENKKLRDQVEELSEETRTKDDLILELKSEVGLLKLVVEGHERTIEHLNHIIERRKLDRD